MAKHMYTSDAAGQEYTTNTRGPTRPIKREWNGYKLTKSESARGIESRLFRRATWPRLLFLTVWGRGRHRRDACVWLCLKNRGSERPVGHQPSAPWFLCIILVLRFLLHHHSSLLTDVNHNRPFLLFSGINVADIFKTSQSKRGLHAKFGPSIEVFVKSDVISKILCVRRVLMSRLSSKESVLRYVIPFSTISYDLR